MQSSHHMIARDISYAASAASRGGRTVIRLIENSTGRLGLIRRARGYDAEVAAGRDFWQVVSDRYGIRLEISGGGLENIPASGPLVVVANHPYGILDGLIMGRILSARRGGDFKLFAHRIFRQAPDLEQVILPVNFDGTKEAMEQNLATRAESLDYLAAGGAIGIFPGGTVSTGAGPFSAPMDPVWRSFTARMVARSGAVVVPIFFEGHNSRLFQIASHLHSTLRLGLLIREFRARLRHPVRVVIGAPIPAERIAALRADPKALMDFLRKSTYDLSPEPVVGNRLGHEFEDRYRKRDGGRDL